MPDRPEAVEQLWRLLDAAKLLNEEDTRNERTEALEHRYREITDYILSLEQRVRDSEASASELRKRVQELKSTLHCACDQFRAEGDSGPLRKATVLTSTVGRWRRVANRGEG